MIDLYIGCRLSNKNPSIGLIYISKARQVDRRAQNQTLYVPAMANRERNTFLGLARQVLCASLLSTC